MSKPKRPVVPRIGPAAMLPGICRSAWLWLVVGTAGVMLGALILSLDPSVRPSAAAPPQDQAQVIVRDFAFIPPTLTVAAGTAVTWINEDDTPHTIMTADRSLRSPGLDTGERFTTTFATPGTYAYFCSLHPHMRGAIVVR